MVERGSADNHLNKHQCVFAYAVSNYKCTIPQLNISLYNMESASKSRILNIFERKRDTERGRNRDTERQRYIVNKTLLLQKSLGAKDLTAHNCISAF